MTSQAFVAPRALTLPSAWDGMEQTMVAAGALDAADQATVLAAAQKAFSAATDIVVQGITVAVLVLWIVVALMVALRPFGIAISRQES
ncbi:hypothetical protein CEJ86_33050 [Sinorhizobium meliloti]|uniref:Uncharacterized protein n=1 Tax=Rhizobium meliloti TaxID=382 RepID=A0A2J0YST2_RHIML|nr:hypothetical protein CEJ86_33050 [Sinorhizobium meliloti]